MADERKYYVLCQNNCKFESMTKEQTLTAIEQAVSTGEIKDVDAGFITRIVEQNGNKPVKIWVGTQAQYNALTEKDDDTLYITDDISDVAALGEEVARVEGEVENLATLVNSFAESIPIKYARNVVLSTGIYYFSASDPLKATAPYGLYHFPALNAFVHIDGQTATKPNGVFVAAQPTCGDECYIYTLKYDESLQRYRMQKRYWDCGNIMDALSSDDEPFAYTIVSRFADGCGIPGQY